MKKLSKIFLLTLLVGLASCEDAIDITQPGRLSTERSFESVDDLEAGLFGVYATIDVSQDISFESAFTDEVAIGFDSGGQRLADYGFILNAGSAMPAVTWTRHYATINAANRLIEAADLITPEDGEGARYNEILGETLAIRAFSHFQLLTYFSTDLTDDSALGVPAIDFVPGIDAQPLRNTNGEVFALINDDLTRAASLISTESEATFISDDFVTALRARIALYRGNYAEAGTLAQTLLDKYPLATRAQYGALWLDQDNTEIIFKLERTMGDRFDGQGATGSAAAGGWAGARFAFVNATLAGSPFLEMGRSLFNELSTDDIRYDVMVAPTSVIADDYQNTANFREDDILVIQKYQGSEGVPLMNDLKVFRSSEMLFIRAEAFADAGDLAGAAGLIKELRDARFGTDQPLPSYGSEAEAFGAILDERRIELAFEGHRYRDLKRIGARGNRGVLKDPLDCAFNGACSLQSTDFRFTLPLPIVEFNANPGLREQQNPGY